MLAKVPKNIIQWKLYIYYSVKYNKKLNKNSIRKYFK